MKYNILISYRTGDTFKSYDANSLLDGTWEDKEIIKENLLRIKEHNDWYRSFHVFPYKGSDEPEWHKGIPENSVVLKLDNGTEYWQSSFWTGHFETLYGAKAIPVKEDELGFDLRF